jgi:O-antigen/teichoic acid export membrane protein
MRQVLRRFAVLGSSSLLTQLIAFAALAYTARKVGPSLLGSYNVALSLVTFLALPISVGITAVGTRDVAQRPDRARQIAGEVFVLQLVLALAGYALVFGLAPVISPTPALRRLLPIVGLFLLTGTSFEWTLQALGQMRVIAVARIVGQVVYGALVPLLVIEGLKGIERYAWLMIGGLALKHLMTTVGVIRATGVPDLRVNLAGLKRRFRSSVPMGYASIMLQLYGTIDQIMLGYLSTSYDAGEYAAANRIPGAVLTFAGSWLAVVFPHSATMASSKQRLRIDTGRLVTVIAMFALPLAACTPFIATSLMTAAFGGQYAAAGTALALLNITVALSLFDGTLTTIIMGLGGDRSYARAITATALLNLGANLVVIPLFGRNGAAVVTIVSEGLLFTILLRSAAGMLGGIPIEWGRMGRIMLAICPAVGSLLLLGGATSVWLRIAVAAVVYLVAALLVGVVRRDEIRALVARQPVEHRPGEGPPIAANDEPRPAVVPPVLLDDLEFEWTPKLTGENRAARGPEAGSAAGQAEWFPHLTKEDRAALRRDTGSARGNRRPRRTD